jgi:hypothetical protein
MLLSSVMVVISTGGSWPAELAQAVIESPLWENELMLWNFAEVSQACLPCEEPLWLCSSPQPTPPRNGGEAIRRDGRPSEVVKLSGPAVGPRGGLGTAGWADETQNPVLIISALEFAVVEALPEARPVDGGRISCPGSAST